MKVSKLLLCTALAVVPATPGFARNAPSELPPPPEPFKGTINLRAKFKFSGKLDKIAIDLK